MPRKRLSVPYLVLSTAPSKKEAHALSKKILAQKFAACINVVYPATSFFRWKGKNQVCREALLVMKTTARQLSYLERLIQKHHSYEVPEIIGWPIHFGNEAYLRWVRSSTHS